MARVLRSNLLTRKKVRISDAYDVFLRSRKTLCAKSTFKIYDEIGKRCIIPILSELTDDDMNNVTVDILRSAIDQYGETHTDGGRAFFHRHLRTFINWYWDEYEIPSKCPMNKIPLKRPAQPPKHGITSDEVDKLIRTAKTRSVFPERDTAMLMILCDTGIRRSSLANLKMRDVDTGKGEMIVFEKDQQYHTKAFGAATNKAIKKYLNCLADVHPDDPFWLQMDGRALTWEGMREVLRRLCSEAGIQMHHFHDFRRFYALELYNSTHDIYLVSRALDHKDIEVTKRYLAIDDTENAESIRTYSPMDRRMHQTGAKVTRVK